MAGQHDINYDDVRLVVDEIIEAGTPVAAISLRQIRSALGDRGSFATISKHLATIKTAIAAGDSHDGELCDGDIAAVRTIIEDIVTRRTFHHRQEAVAARVNAAEEIRLGEIANANLRDVISDLEGQNDGLSDALSDATARVGDLTTIITRLEGRIEALDATLATFASATTATRDDLDVGATGPKLRSSRRSAKAGSATDLPEPSQVTLPLGVADDDAADGLGV